LLGLRPERSRLTGRDLVRAAGAALLGDSGLRHPSRPDPGVSHVLLAVALATGAPRPALRPPPGVAPDPAAAPAPVRPRRRRRAPECRASRLLLAAASELRAGGGALLARDPARLAVVVGTALGGVEEGERALAGATGLRTLAGALYDSPARNLARGLGARGPVLTVSTACASGATALGVGAELV